MAEPIVLAVGPSASTCRACGRGASWRTETHEEIVEYGPDTGKPGCGARWTHIVGTYWDPEGVTAARLRDLRPDLELIA